MTSNKSIPTKPDWKYWRREAITLQEAILISVDIEPRDHLFGEGLSMELKEEIFQRTIIALEGAALVGWVLDKGSSYPYSSYLMIIRLPLFRRWAIDDAGWDTPVEFQKSKGLALNSEISKKKGRPTISEEKIKELYQHHLKNPSLSHDELGEKFKISRASVSNYIKKIANK